jgi:hypothetical protein
MVAKGDGWNQGVCLEVDGVRVIQADVPVKTLLSLQGTTREVVVRGALSLFPEDIVESLIRLDGGLHYNPTVECSHARRQGIVDVLNNGAQLIQDKPTTIGSMTDEVAPNSSLYYSTSKAALSFKDIDGVVHEVIVKE